MITFNFKNIKINIYTDPMEFANCDEKPFGEIPDDYTFAGVQGGNSTGFASIDLNMISIYVGPNCEFKDLLSTTSHELGHLIEGGFKKNPPQKDRYFNKHEEKANHYENFVLDSYDLTNLIFSKITK